jgi:NADH-quinone oxidoreductase subunit L
LPEATHEALHHASFNWPIALGSSAMALAGIGAAWLFYGVKVLSSSSVRTALAPVHHVLERKYYLDDLYERFIVEAVAYRTVARFLAWFDQTVVDGVSRGIGASLKDGSEGLRRLQTGQVQVYGVLGLLGIVIAGGLMFVLHPL